MLVASATLISCSSGIVMYFKWLNGFRFWFATLNLLQVHFIIYHGKSFPWSHSMIFCWLNVSLFACFIKSLCQSYFCHTCNNTAVWFWRWNPTKCLWRWEPNRRYNFFFSPPVRSHIWLKYCCMWRKTPINSTEDDTYYWALLQGSPCPEVRHFLYENVADED